MFKIGEFSRLSNVSVRMLRHYDKLGLLVPEIVDQSNGYRYYPARQLGQANRIQQLKALGFSLAIIKEMLEAQDEDDIQAYFERRKDELGRELADLNFQSTMLSKARQIIREDTRIMDYSVVLKEIPARRVISVRDTIPTYQDERLLWERLGLTAKKQDTTLTNPPYAIAIFHDEDVRETDCDVEVQFSIEGDCVEDGDMKVYDAPAVQVASVTFHGDYEQMPHVMEALATWIEANNYQINGPMFNIMHVSPGHDSDPANWVTESCWPVGKAN